MDAPFFVLFSISSVATKNIPITKIKTAPITVPSPIGVKILLPFVKKPNKKMIMPIVSNVTPT